MVKMVRQIADSYVESFSRLDPSGADVAGVAGDRSELTLYSPEAEEARDQLRRQTLTDLGTADLTLERDRVAADFMKERLQIEVDKFAAGENLRDLNVIASPTQAVRQAFDVAPKQTPVEWERIVARVEMVPAALESIKALYSEGLARGLIASRRQATEVAKQMETMQDRQTGYFGNLLRTYDSKRLRTESLRQRLESGSQAASQALQEMGRFLKAEYAPKADTEEAVGRERYEFAARSFCGKELDLDETYQWGWEEFYRIEEQMRQVAGRIAVGKSISEVVQLLDTDPKRRLSDPDEMVQWLQELEDDAMRKLDGVHFEIPAPVKHIEVLLDPPGGAAAAHYSPPSEDFSRPGRYWFPVNGQTVFPKWGEVTTAYHEGFPGHHLQCAQVMYLAAQLNRFQQTFGWVSGHGEGWALYAERLMFELGFLENPDYELGWLAGQALRAGRVIIDIGMHLKKAIPSSEKFHPGEVWNRGLGSEFMMTRALQARDFVESEIDRYLGWPGQAISYKVGERIWLEGRQAAMDRAGSDYDPKAFHAYALALGPLGLDQLYKELANMPVGSKAA